MVKELKLTEEYNQDTISTAPYSSFLYNRNIEKHSHIFFEFTFCLSGELINVVNGNKIPTKSFSELIIIRPGDTHEIIREGDGIAPEYHRDIYCLKDKFKKICDFIKPGLYEDIVSRKDPIVLRCDRTKLEALEQSCSELNCDVIYLKERMEELERHHLVVIANVLDLYLSNEEEKREPYPDWIEQFLQSLNTEKTLSMPLNEIIKDMNYSRGHICREFKKYVGKTMVECLNESRIFYSAMLLSNSDIPLLDIAMKLNFSSQSAFTNAFKKIYGISPRAWRKTHR